MYNQSIQIINKLRNQFDRKLKNNNSYKDNNLYNASENYSDTTNMYDMTPTQQMRSFQMGGAPQGQPQAQPNPSSDYMQQLMQKVGGQGAPQGQPQEPMQQPDQAAQGMPSNEELVQMFQQLPPEIQEQIKQMPPQQQPQAIMQAFQQVQAQGQQPQQEEMQPASPEEMAQMTPAEQMACGGMVKKKDFTKVNLPKADFGKDLGAGLYGAGEGLLDTLTMGATDGLTDMGYTALQDAAGSTNAEKKQQNAIRGYSALAGNIGGALINPGATGTAFSQGAKNLNTGLQNTNGVSDDVKKWSGTLLPVAGKIGGMAAGNAGGGDMVNMAGSTGGFDVSKWFTGGGKGSNYTPMKYGGKLKAYQEGGEIEQDDSQEQSVDDFEFEYRDIFDKLDADTQDSIMEQVLQYPNEQQDKAMKQAVANVMQQKQQQAREQQIQQQAQQQAQQQEAERQALEAKAQGRNPEQEQQQQQQYQEQDQQPQDENQYGEERSEDEGYYRNGGYLQTGGFPYKSKPLYNKPKANIQQVVKGPYAEPARERILREEYLKPNETVQAYLKHQQGNNGYNQIVKGMPSDSIARNMKANVATEMKPGFDKLTPLAKAATFIDFWNHKTNTLDVPNNDITKAIRQTAKKHGVNPDLYVKMAMLESSLNPEAVSASGNHIGIQQIAKKYMSNPDHAKDPTKATEMAIRLAKNQFKKGKLDYGFEPIKQQNTQANYNPGDMVQFEMGGKIHSGVVKSYNRITGDLDLI